jgi:hypothetical protein
MGSASLVKQAVNDRPRKFVKAGNPVQRRSRRIEINTFRTIDTTGRAECDSSEGGQYDSRRAPQLVQGNDHGRKATSMRANGWSIVRRGVAGAVDVAAPIHDDFDRRQFVRTQETRISEKQQGYSKRSHGGIDHSTERDSTRTSLFCPRDSSRLANGGRTDLAETTHRETKNGTTKYTKHTKEWPELIHRLTSGSPHRTTSGSTTSGSALEIANKRRRSKRPIQSIPVGVR